MHDQQPNHPQIFVGDGAAPFERRHAERLELALEIADAEAEHQPSARQLRCGRRHLRQQDRIAIGRDQHVGAERQAGGQAHAEDRASDRVIPVRVRLLGRIARHDDVIAEPDRVEAEPLGLDDQPALNRAVAIAVIGRNADPDAHLSSLPRRCQTGQCSALQGGSQLTFAGFPRASKNHMFPNIYAPTSFADFR